MFSTNKTNEDILLYFLENGSFEYDLMPIYSVHEDKVSYFEVLSRLLINETLFYPRSFIGYIEKLGFENFTISKFEALLKLLVDKEIPGLTFNMLQSELNIEFAKRLAKLAEKHEIDPSSVVIEINESTIFNSRVKDAIKSFKNAGFIIAIDDFGVGTSHIKHIIDNENLIDIVKIDGIFTRELEYSNKRQEGLKHIINFMHTFGKKVIVEHIESKKLFDTVKELNADYLQGYYIGKPKSINKTKGF